MGFFALYIRPVAPAAFAGTQRALGHDGDLGAAVVEIDIDSFPAFLPPFV